MVVGAATPDCEAGLRLRCAVVTPCPHLRLGPPFQAITFATRSSAGSSRPDDRRVMGRVEAGAFELSNTSRLSVSPLKTRVFRSYRGCLLERTAATRPTKVKGRPRLCMGWSNTHITCMITWSKHVGSREAPTPLGLFAG